MKKQLLAFILSITFFIPNNAFSMDEDLNAKNPRLVLRFKAGAPHSSWMPDLEEQHNFFVHKISAAFSEVTFDPRNWTPRTKVLLGLSLGAISLHMLFNYVVYPTIEGYMRMPLSRFIPCN